VVWENVPGVLSSHGGKDFASVLEAFTGVRFEIPAEGWKDTGVAVGPLYSVAWASLDAQWFHVPQRRNRVFLVASLGARSGPYQVLSLAESVPWDSPPSREAGARIAAGLTRGSAIGRGVNQPGRRCEDDVNLVAFGGNNTSGEIDVATACNAHGGTGRHDFESETFVCGPLQAHAAEHGHAMTTQQAVESGHVIAHTLRAEGFDASEDGTGRGTQVIPIKYARGATKNGAVKNSIDGPNDGPMFPLEAEHEHAIALPIAFNACESQSSGECIDIAPTLRSGSGTGGATMPAIAFTELGEGHVTYQETETAGSLRTPDGGGSGLANVVAFQRKYYGNQPEQGGKPSDVSPAITSAQAERSDGEITVAYRTSGNCGVMEQGDKTAALTTATDPNATIIRARMAVRRLTPVECERLMGWEDGRTTFGEVNGRVEVMSDSARYRMCGNGVVATVAFWIAERIMAIDKR